MEPRDIQDDDQNQPTPFGTLRYAEDYRIAAEKVIGDENSLKSVLLMPAYHLMGHSIELSLKAHLLATGVRNSKLMGRGYGHDIERLLRKAVTRDLSRLVPVDDTERHIVQVLAAPHRDHQFRYIKVGSKTLPFWSEVGALAKKLTHGLHDHCLELRIGVEAARHRIAICGKF